MKNKREATRLGRRDPASLDGHVAGKWRWLAGAVLGLALAGVAISEIQERLARSRRPENVLLITVDTLRADRLACYGFKGVETPNMDKLSREGMLFQRAIAVAPSTLPSHSSILTGLYPYRHGVRDNVGFLLDEKETTLAELLRERGFATAGFVSAYVLDGLWGTHQGFELYYDDFGRIDSADENLLAYQRPGAETLLQWESWLDRISSRSHFAWIHLFEPHYPYLAPEPYRTRYRSDPYAGEVAYVDELVGRILDGLKRRGLLDRTLVVLTSDHGEGLGDHGEKTHSFFVYNSTLRVPLILRGPGVPRHRVIHEQVSIVDILPTVLELTEIAAPQGLDGRSLLKPDSSRQIYAETLYPNLHYGWSPLFSLQDKRYKVIIAPRPEAFDLDRDPRETTNLFPGPPPAALALMEQLGAIVQQAGAPVPARPPGAEQLTRLSALGYLGSPSSRPSASLADPKAKIAVFNRMQEAWDLLRNGRSRGALAIAEELASREPTLPDAFYLVGRALFEQRDFERAALNFEKARALQPESVTYLLALAQAVEHTGKASRRAAELYAEVLKRYPTDLVALLRLGRLSFEAGDLEEARSLFRRMLAIDPRSAHAENNLGTIALYKGELDTAEKHFLRALELDPQLENAHYNLGVVYQQRGDRVHAEAEYREEIRLRPGNVKAHHNLGLLHAEAGNVQGQLEAFRRVVRLNPASAIGNYLLGDALFQLQKPQEALIYAERATTLDPGLRQAFLLLAEIHSKLGNQHEQQRALARARSIRSGR